MINYSSLDKTNNLVEKLDAPPSLHLKHARLLNKILFRATKKLFGFVQEKKSNSSINSY